MPSYNASVMPLIHLHIKTFTNHVNPHEHYVYNVGMILAYKPEDCKECGVIQHNHVNPHGYYV